MAKRDFFVGYTSADRDRAEWIGRQLEAAGYTILLQGWDIRSGMNVLSEMQKGAEGSIRTLIVLSPSFLDLKLTEAELTSVFGRDPVGQFEKLVPIRVVECNPAGLLGHRKYIELVGLSEEATRSALLAAVKGAPESQRPSQVFVILRRESAMDLLNALAQALVIPVDGRKGKTTGKSKGKGTKGTGWARPKGLKGKGLKAGRSKGLKGYEHAAEGVSQKINALDIVNFTTYYPRTSIPGRKYGLLVYAHLPELKNDVNFDAQKFATELGDRIPPPRGTRATVKLERGTPITVVPECREIDFDPPELTKRGTKVGHASYLTFNYTSI